MASSGTYYTACSPLRTGFGLYGAHRWLAVEPLLLNLSGKVEPTHLVQRRVPGEERSPGPRPAPNSQRNHWRGPWLPFRRDSIAVMPQATASRAANIRLGVTDIFRYPRLNEMALAASKGKGKGKGKGKLALRRFSDTYTLLARPPRNWRGMWFTQQTINRGTWLRRLPTLGYKCTGYPNFWMLKPCLVQLSI
ncbi:uncharacterized protein BDW70DRAFT_153290 [Aspergillus foveolatus]|uniref:uncharacterized protein n=1 Tax=Aspergillus foveolatus TaxID=210207 RepID=UPI003CCCAA9E